jgi:hypothetical protein
MSLMVEPNMEREHGDVVAGFEQTHAHHQNGRHA